MLKKGAKTVGCTCLMFPADFNITETVKLNSLMLVKGKVKTE